MAFGIRWPTDELEQARVDTWQQDAAEKLAQFEARTKALLTPAPAPEPAPEPFTVDRQGLMPWLQDAGTQVASSAGQATTGAAATATDLFDRAALMPWAEPEQPAASQTTPDMQSEGQGVYTPDDQPPNLPAMRGPTPGPTEAVPASQPSPGGGEIDNSSRAAFVKSAWPHMLAAAGGNRDAAQMMLAAAISENGSIGSGKPFWANNFFGIKGKGDAGSVSAATHEIVNGARQDISDTFAAYSSPVAGFRAFFDFLGNNSRYAPALQHYQQTGDAVQLFRDVNAAGYATDPNWASKVESIRATQVAPLVVPTAAGASSPPAASPAPAAAADPQQPPAGASPLAYKAMSGEPEPMPEDASTSDRYWTGPRSERGDEKPRPAQSSVPWNPDTMQTGAPENTPAETLSYRQPLSGTSISDLPDDPRDADQGAHEATAPPGNPPGSQSEPPDVPFTSSYNDPTAGGTIGTPVAQQNTPPTPARYNPYGIPSDPTDAAVRGTTPDQPPEPPSPTSTMLPVWDENGEQVGWRRESPQARANAQQSADAGPVQSTPGEPDYVPPPRGAVQAASDAVDTYLPPAGGAPEDLARLDQIAQQAARWTGRSSDPNERIVHRAVDDPAWRAAFPDLAQEYDDLQTRLGLVVGGMAGAGGGHAPEPKPPRPTVEVLREQLDAARAAIDDARQTGDRAAVAQAQDRAAAIESDLVDAVNSRRAAEPAIESDIGRRIEQVPPDVRGDDSLERLSAARGYSGYDNSPVPPNFDQQPLGRYEPTRSVSLNATAGAVPESAAPTDRLGVVNRVLGQGMASSVSGGLGAAVNQQANPDDPNAGLEGFAAGALVPAIGGRGIRAGLRLAGKSAEEARGALTSLGDVPPSKVKQVGLPGIEHPPYEKPKLPDVSQTPNRAPVLGDVPPSEVNQGMLPGLNPLQGSRPTPLDQVVEQLQTVPGVSRQALGAAQRRAQSMQRRGLTTPSAWDWIKQAGYAGIYGPPTFVSSVVGGAQELVLGQPKEAIRALTSGRPGAYGAQVKGQLRAMPEGLVGFGRVLLGSDQAAAAASGGSRGSADLSERVINPIGHFAARVLERPGELLTEAPDAVFRPLFLASGMEREARTIAAEQGLRGAQAAGHADTLMQEAERLRTNPDTAVASADAHRIVEAGAAYADELGYKGKPGGLGQWLGALAKRDDPVGVLASLLVPFPSMAARMTRSAARSTPGIGLLPAIRKGQPTRFDVVYDQAFGTALAAGIAAWAFNGGVTGSGPADPEKRKEMVDQGWQPNATLIAGHYIPNRVFQRFQPLLDTAGELHDALTYGKPDTKPGALAADLVKRGSRVATDQVGLSGLADLHDMLTQGFAAQFPGWAARSAMRYLPYGGILRAAATSLDPTQRKPEGWADVGLGEAVRQQATTAIPGARQGVPAAQGVLGRPAPNPQQGFGAIIPRVTTQRDDPIIRLFQDAGVGIASPRTQMAVGRVSGVDLAPAEQRRWNEHRGRFIQEYADAYTGNPDFMALAPAQKQKYLTAFLAKAADYADKMVQSEMDSTDLTNRATDAAVKKAS